MTTKYKAREYDTLRWKQRATVHQAAAHAAIAYAESAVADLKRLRDQPAVQALNEAGVTDASFAVKALIIALDKIWDHAGAEPSFEPGIFAEVNGKKLYELIKQAKEVK